jgi:hypothetical protein
MEWWQIVSAVAAVFIAISQYYVWVLPIQRRKKQESKDTKAVVKKALKDVINRIQEYEYLERRSKLREWVNNAFIPKKWRKELAELANLAEEYDKWRWESYQVIRAEFQLVAASQRFEDKHLDEWLRIFGLWEVTEGRERGPGETIYKAIYSANLTFGLAKEAMLENRRDLLRKAQKETSGEEIEIKLRDIVESDAFYRLTKELRGLQERETIKTVREIRAELLRKAKLLEEA